MTDQRDGLPAAAPAAPSGIQITADQRLAARPSMATPPPEGAPGVLANKVLVYLRPNQVDAVLAAAGTRVSGMILAGARPTEALRAIRAKGFGFPVLIDPAQYEAVTATCDAPFILPGGGGMTATLASVLDGQLQAGATVALSPTGFIPAGATDVLKAAVAQFGQLCRTDSIFVAPLHVSLVDRAFFAQTAAILASLGRPVAVVLGRQGDPLSQSRHIIPNLRQLARTVQLMAIRTDFNGLDQVAHGAFSAAIGTGGKLRHTVEPTDKQRSFKWDGSPSVLFPELVTWYKGSTINEFFGARPTLAPKCDCIVCDGQRITRFLRREDQNDAIAHAIAVWSRWADDLLAAATMRDRAQYWQNLCTGAVTHHAMFLELLRRLDGLRLQDSMKRWSSLPAWPADVPAPVS